MNQDSSPQREPPAKRKWRWRRLLVELAVVLALVAAVGAWQKRHLVEGEAPPLVGLTLDGERFDLAAWRGEPVLIYFWATWCPVCKLERPTIDGLMDEHRVITIAMQSGDAREVGEHLAEHGLNWPVLLDPEGELARRYGVRGVPTSLVLDREGRIRYAEVGYTTGPGLRLRLWLAGL